MSVPMFTSTYVEASVPVRPVFNFAPRGVMLTPGVKLAPDDELFPLGVKTLCLPLHFSER
jgi:hypothetical protein